MEAAPIDIRTLLHNARLEVDEWNGTTENLLFSAKSIADYFSDRRYAETINPTREEIEWETCKLNGRDVLCFTEYGVYQYILKRKCDKAKTMHAQAKEAVRKMIANGRSSARTSALSAEKSSFYRECAEYALNGYHSKYTYTPHDKYKNYIKHCICHVIWIHKFLQTRRPNVKPLNPDVTFTMIDSDSELTSAIDAACKRHFMDEDSLVAGSEGKIRALLEAAGYFCPKIQNKTTAPTVVEDLGNDVDSSDEETEEQRREAEAKAEAKVREANELCRQRLANTGKIIRPAKARGRRGNGTDLKPPVTKPNKDVKNIIDDDDKSY